MEIAHGASRMRTQQWGLGMIWALLPSGPLHTAQARMLVLLYRAQLVDGTNPNLEAFAIRLAIVLAVRIDTVG